MKARAKHDVFILMEDGRYSDFRKGNEYRCLLRGNGVILIDEKHMGFSCDMEQFAEDFVLLDSENG